MTGSRVHRAIDKAFSNCYVCPHHCAGLAWEWMEDWLKVQEGKSGGQMPKQYRLGQFKGGG